VAASDWPRGKSHRQVGPLTGQRSMVNFDWAETGLWRVRLGLDMGRVGPVLAGPAQTHVKLRCYHIEQLDSNRAQVHVVRCMVVKQVWFTSHVRGSRWTRSILSLPLTVHGAPSAPSSPSAHLPSLSPHGRTPAGGERLFSAYGGPMTVAPSSTATRGHQDFSGGI
jgi:hypothetical protein